MIKFEWEDPKDQFECEYEFQCSRDESKENPSAPKREIENKCRKGCGKRLAYYIGSLSERKELFEKNNPGSVYTDCIGTVCFL